ncbi:NHL repeat-containing protein [Haploplasma axanthum]|nr:hypothetical protein [Haploplasma axanthum]
MKKKIIIIALLIIIPLLMGSKPYNYSYYGEVISSSPGMTFQTYINGQTLGTSIGTPHDLYVYQEEIYMVAQTNNGGKLLIINKEYQLVEDIQEFEYADEFLDKLKLIKTDMADDQILMNRYISKTLDTPTGIDVKEDAIYIADSKNKRIVKLNFEYQIIDIFYEQEKISEQMVYEPRKISVDSSGRMYVAVDNAYEGIIELDVDGSFNRFLGTNTIKHSPFEMLRRSLMTEEQRKKLDLALSTSYTNVNVNEKGFIFATAKPTENNNEKMIQLINPKGVDVLKRNGYHVPMGDVEFLKQVDKYTSKVGPSKLVDVAYTKNGIYTVLDEQRSKLFTYDQEGNLLYINGSSSEGTNTQSDKLEKPVAIDYFGDDILVLDGDQRATKIVVLRLTEFGKTVNDAIELHSIGKFEEASKLWEKVLILNTNYEVAYNGIGKNELRQKNYKIAMQNFEKGHDSYYYSKAFKSYRNQIIKKYFSVMVTGIAVLVVGSIVYKKRDKIFKKGENK